MKKLFEKTLSNGHGDIFLIMLINYDSVPFFLQRRRIFPHLVAVPLYIFGWIVHTAITFVLIIVYYRMCMKRKEYHTYDEEDK